MGYSNKSIHSLRVLHVVNAYPAPGNPQAGAFTRIQIESMKRHCAASDVFLLKGRFKYLAGVQQLRRFLKPRNYDLLHAHYSFSALPALFQYGYPVVISFMGSDVNGDYSARFFKTYRFLNFVLSKLMALCAQAVIVKSGRMAKRLGGNAIVIPNGVDFTQFRPLDRTQCRAELGLDPAKIYCCFAADPRKRVKNASLARAAVASLSKRGMPAELLVVHGRPQVEYLKYLNAADCLLCTSFSEGSPNVVKEALACNLPVVSVDVGDVKEHLTGVTNCIMVEYDVDAVAGAVEDVIGRGGSDGRQRCRYLDVRVVADAVADVYKNVIDKD